MSYTQIQGVSFAAAQPVSILPAANGRIYAVNGLARGAAYFGGTTAYSIGITAAASISVATQASPLFHYVSSVEIQNGGQNYFRCPAVTIAGVTRPKAELAGAEVARVVVTTSATTHTRSPDVLFSDGQASGATAAPVMRGQVAGVHVGIGGYYSAPPAVTFAAASGVTTSRTAVGRAILDFSDGLRSGTVPVGRMTSVVVADSGEYMHSGSVITPVTASVTGSPVFGGNPFVTPEYSATVDAVTVVSGGTSYSSGPRVSFISHGPKRAGGGAAAVAGVTGGQVDSVTMTAFGSGYDGRVTAALTNEPAKAAAIITPRLLGKYLCAIRYIDASGVTGNLCDLREVNCEDGASSLVWTLPGAVAKEPRVASMELWRTTSDQAITLYRVATVAASATSHTDSLTDSMLLDSTRAAYGELPILTPEGYPNANRFGVPPSNFSTICMFADRAWYAVDESGAESRTLYFSEVGEPESVPPEYQVVLQTAGRESDRITGLIPTDGVLYVCQQRSVVRLTVSGHPLESAAATPVIDRGLLNDRCWDKYEGVAYVADAVGLYAFDGSTSKPISDSIKDFWTAPRIDFTRSKSFYVRVHPLEQVVRFHYVPTGSSSTSPTAALCYSLVTQAWWTESYADDLRCTVLLYNGARATMYAGGFERMYELGSGLTDNGGPILYSLKTGNMSLNDDPKRGVRLTYTPTSSTHNLGVELHYNGSSTPRPNAIQTNPGAGFVTTTGGTQATLNMGVHRSALGNASGFAQFTLAGRLDDRSAGADRSVAIRMSGSQSGGIAGPAIHRVQIDGVG
jgi:hypothetical protein